MADQTDVEAVAPDGTAEAPVGEADSSQPNSLDEALGADGQLSAEIEQSLADSDGAPVSRLELDELESSPGESVTMRDLDLLADVEVEVAVEFGRTRLPLRQLLTLRRGSLVEMARRPEQQVTVLANGTPIALGDIVVVGEHIGVHIVELIDATQPTIVEQFPLPQADISEAVETDPVDGQPDMAGDDPAAEDS